MAGRRIAGIAISALVAAMISRGAIAQPADPNTEIEIDPQGSGSGSGSGSASAAKPAADTSAPAKDPKVAKKWLLAAQQLVQKGLYFASHGKPDDAKQQLANAVTAYQKAIEAGDDINVYFELAGAEEKLEKIDDAVRHLRVVTTAKTGVRPDIAKKASAKLDDLSAKVGLVTLAITPDGTTVTLGGTEVGKSPLPEPLVLMPGTYTLAFAADGFQPKEAEIKVEAGSESERRIELEPVKTTVAPTRPVGPGEAPVTPSAGPDRLPLYIGAGAAGVGVLGMTVFGIAAVVEHGTFVGKTTSASDRADAQSNGKTFAVLADVSLGVTLVAAGFTAYWYYYKYKKTPKKAETATEHARVLRPAPQSAKIIVAPWVQPEAGGLSLTGAF